MISSSAAPGRSSDGSGTGAAPSLPLHLALSMDEAYAPHGANMLRSFFDWHPRLPVTVHLIYDDRLSPSARGVLRGMVESEGADWQEHEVAADVVRRLPTHAKYPKSAWFRILFPELVPASRVLYLDCDLIVTGSLLPLWELDLDGRLLAAAVDGMWPQSTDHFHRFIFELGLESAEEYFNTGVMVMDLAAMREQGLTERLMDFVIGQRGPMPCADQDAMNAVLRHRWLRLPPQWNLMPPLMLSWTQGVGSLSRSDILIALLRPRVVHYFGEFKPWRADCRHPLRMEYWRSRPRTPWPADVPYLPTRTERWLAGAPQPVAIAVRGMLQFGWLVVAHWHLNNPRYVGGWLLQQLPRPLGSWLRRQLRRRWPPPSGPESGGSLR